MCFVLCLCCAFSIPAIVWCWCCPYFIGSQLVFWDGFQAQKRGMWILGKERAESVLANAISIDGRKEWTCKFCSESNVWTRWLCRRCYSDAGRSGESSTGSTTSSGEEDRKTRSLEAEKKKLRARIDALEKKGGEGVQRGERRRFGRCVVRGHTWTSRMRPRAVKNWMSKRKKLQEELRDVTGEYQRVPAAPAARGGEKEA